MIDPPAPAGPGRHWLLGHLPLLRRDILSLLEELPREHGDLVPLRFGGHRALLLSHPAHVEAVLVTQGANFEKPPRFRRIVGTAFGKGIFAAEGAAWQQQREVMQTVLATIDLHQHARVVMSCAERVLGEWPAEDAGDLAGRMVELALAVRARTALAIDRPDTLPSIHAALAGFMEYYTTSLRSPLNWPLWVPTSANRRMRDALAVFRHAIDDEIRQAGEPAEGRDDLLGRLMQHDLSAAMSRRQLRDELATWLLTGTETTANTLAWTCYLLARHPDQHDRLLSDLAAIDLGRSVQHGGFLRIRRLGWVLAESMRLYPQAYLIGRKAKAPFTIDGRTFPGRTTVILNQWFIGRDPRWYEQPLTFDPDRWSVHEPGRAPAFVHFPFGGGARACLGRSLAAVELPLLLAAVAQRFRFELPAGSDVRPGASLTLRPLFGHGAIVMRRR